MPCHAPQHPYARDAQHLGKNLICNNLWQQPKGRRVINIHRHRRRLRLRHCNKSPAKNVPRNSFNLFMPRARARSCCSSMRGRQVEACSRAFERGRLLKNAKDCSAAICLALERATVLALAHCLPLSLSRCLRHVASSARLIGCGLIKSDGDRPPTNCQLV